MTTVNKLRCLCGLAPDDASRDEVLGELLEQAAAFASVFTGVDYSNSDAEADAMSTAALDAAVAKMVAEDFGRLGSGGISYKSYSNVNESYHSNYSADIYKLLGRARRLSVPLGGGTENA